MGGYGADGMPAAMTGTQVGSGFVDQMGLEAGAQGEMRSESGATSGMELHSLTDRVVEPGNSRFVEDQRTV